MDDLMWIKEDFLRSQLYKCWDAHGVPRSTIIQAMFLNLWLRWYELE